MKDIRINLLPKKKKRLIDKLLYFGLHYFRYIIVITQIAVISVFFFRFYIDQQIIDYKEAFSQKQQILSITFPLIAEAEELSIKTKHIRELIDSQNKYVEILSYIFTNIPADMTISSFEWGEDKIYIKGQSITSGSVQSMKARLTQSKRFKEIVIENVIRNIDSQFDFSIIVTI